MIQSAIQEQAKILWEYHLVHHSLTAADAILVCCSHDLRIADYATDLFVQKYAPLLIFSGGIAHQNDLLATGWNTPEAEVFAKRAIETGVPPENIVIENRALNTGENILFTRKLLEEIELDCNSLIVVQKPYMERRTFATFKKQWPEQQIAITSPPLSFEEYVTDEFSFDTVVNLIVGDLQRIIIYAEKGFQITQEIPQEVWEAYEDLVKAGYDRHLV